MSDFLEVIGEVPLKGKVIISGAKNAVLPQLMAALLTSEEVQFDNVPNLEDVNLALHLLEHFGAQTSRRADKVTVSVPKLNATEASYSLVKALRASFWVLAPLLARGGAARVSLPGGDIIGARPVDIHLEALTKMGADIKVKHGVVYATALDGLKAADISFRFPSVGATHQILMAASLTPGVTTIRGAAREPEVIALAHMLTTMGTEIEGAGQDTIVIRGRESLGGAKLRMIGDRIEAGTYLLAAAVSRGSIEVEGIDPSFLHSFLNILEEMGLSITRGENTISVANKNGMRGVKVSTAPFPGLATDLQAPLMAALCFAEGASTIEEHVYEGRFGHVSELCRMGAEIRVEDRTAIINPNNMVSSMSGAHVEGMDIRAAASLVVAALGCNGTSVITEPQHLRRGYENIDGKLRALGANVSFRYSDPEDFVFSGC